MTVSLCNGFVCRWRRESLRAEVRDRCQRVVGSGADLGSGHGGLPGQTARLRV